MADITRLQHLSAGAPRGVDISANTLVTLSVKVGGPTTNTELTKAILDNLVQLQNGSDASTLHNHDGAYHTKTILASNSNAQGASLVGIEDAANHYTATNVEAALSEVKTIADAAIPASQKGQPNGVATLGGDGKVPLSQIAVKIMTYEGMWNAATNSPTLADGSGDTGQMYKVSVAGSHDFGSGAISFEVGDYAIYNSSGLWEKSDTTDAVKSVNGLTGEVVLNSDTVGEGSTNLYHTTARARVAAVVNSTAGNETDQAPSVAAVKAYISTATTSVKTLADTELAGEALSAGQVWAVRAAIPALSETPGRFYKAEKATASEDLFYVDGIAIPVAPAAPADPVVVVRAGKVTIPSHGFTVGRPLFLGAAGVVSNTPSSTSGDAVVRIGKVLDANTLDIKIEVVGVI